MPRPPCLLCPPACLPACRGRRVLYDVAKGLTYLHHRRIVHLDLKSGA
jgi:serine/threonine protein kinase